jgi:hypothetical protein
LQQAERRLTIQPDVGRRGLAACLWSYVMIRGNATVFHPLILAAVFGLAANGTVLADDKDKDKDQKESFAFKPDPELLKRLTKTGMVDNYQLKLPAEYTSVNPPDSPKGTKTVLWKGDERAGDAAILLVSVSQSLEEAKEPKQVMNFLRRVGININGKGKAESGELDGMPFSRFKWSGNVGKKKFSKVGVRGMVYTGIDNNKAISILVVCFGPNSMMDNHLLEAAVATLK